MKFNIVHIILAVILLWFIYSACTNNVCEGMAPLNTGTYKNNYTVGKCNTDFKRTDCMVGNCPLGSTISNTEYCSLQCAQDPDATIRQECENTCMKIMSNDK